MKLLRAICRLPVLICGTVWLVLVVIASTPVLLVYAFLTPEHNRATLARDYKAFMRHVLF